MRTQPEPAAPPAAVDYDTSRGRRFLRSREGRDAIISVASPFVLLAVWQALAVTGILDTRFYPPPTEIFDTGVDAIASGELLGHVAVSMTRVAIGFAIGAVAGIMLGLLAGLLPVVRAAVKPLIDATYPIPKSALLPLFLMIFGLGEQSKWAIIAVATFFLVVINTMVGVLSIDRIYLDVAKNYGASRLLRLRDIALPGALPVMFAGLRLGLGVSLIILVYAESVAADRGIGYLIWNSWQVFDVPRMYLGIATTALLGLAVTMILDAVERVLVPWRK